MTRYLWPLRLAGAGLLVATAGIHLDLYLTGFRTIPVIGWLFLLQVIVAFGLALAVLTASLVRSWLAAAVAAAGAGFAITTLGASLLSLWVGLFGFRDVRTTAGLVAGIVEIAAFGVLALLAVASIPAARAAMAGSRWAGWLRRVAVPAVAGLIVVALAVFGVSVAAANGGSSASASTSTSAVLRTASVGGVTLLTDSKGLTLYWFAPDTPAKSVCYGLCATYWPPVYGTPVVAAGVTGVTGKLGTIRRSDGSIQATYDGHPLYTYVSDTAPGEATGNDIDLNGGFWYDIPVHRG